MDRDTILRELRSHLDRQMRARYGAQFVRNQLTVRVTEQREYGWRVVSQGEPDANGCRRVVEEYKTDYKFEVDLTVWIDLGQGPTIAGTATLGPYEVTGETQTRTTLECPPGLFDLPSLPGNYALLEGETLIWEGAAASVLFRNGGLAALSLGTSTGAVHRFPADVLSQPIGKPSVRAQERLAAWHHNEIRTATEIFLPGGVIESDAGDIPAIIPTVVVRTRPEEIVLLQFKQATKNAHLGVSREIEELRSSGRIQQIGMHVRSSATFGALLEKADKVSRKRENGRAPKRIGEVEVCFWLQVEGRRDPSILSELQAHLYGKTYIQAIELNKVGEKLFGPLLFCPEWWCLNPLCHSHWYWFPGVPASTICGGRCVIGGPCQCWNTLVRPPAWAGACPGLKTCWC